MVPLPYNALARGHWAGLFAYAAAPWVLAAIGRLSSEQPFPVTRLGRTGGRVVGLGLLVAVAAPRCPSLLFVVPISASPCWPGQPSSARPEPDCGCW